MKKQINQDGKAASGQDGKAASGQDEKAASRQDGKTIFPKDSRFELRRWRVIALCLVLYDVAAVNFSYFFGLLLRFDFQFSMIPQKYLHSFLAFSPFYTAAAVCVFYVFRMYNSLWRYASVDEMFRVIAASAATTLIQTAGITLFVMKMPLSYYVIGAMVQFFLVMAARFGYRFVRLERTRRTKSMSAKDRVMVIGAGRGGCAVLRELKDARELSAVPCCVIDDDPNTWGRYMEGVKIVGGRESILEAAEQYRIDEIMFAIPSASKEERRDILNICSETGCGLKTLPGLYQMANGDVVLSKMKEVAIEDLLGREPIQANMETIFQQIKGKVILVTGGGGSIGSELCRQIAAHEPEQLIIFEIYENNAYEIEQELKRKYGDALNLVVLIGSVRDSRRINMVMEEYKPQIVYHAAAHKHVPLMEDSPNEAIKNNVIGTYKTAYAAMKNKAERFVLISTDKAVYPTNIMGASKRICEMVIQTMDAVSRSGRIDILPELYEHADEDMSEREVAVTEEKAWENIRIECVKNNKRTGTQFVAVRFGNVLGSNGSVIPLFQKQIEAGGPVTVTHPDIVRYFMTIPEAVSLVLQAGMLAWGGEIFVLEMGEPVRIMDLALNLIKLSGLKPGTDIELEISGLRAGEKLFEEPLLAEEDIKPTEIEKIRIGKPIPFEVSEFLSQLEELAAACHNNSGDIVGMVEKIVPTFHPAGRQPQGKEQAENGPAARPQGKEQAGNGPAARPKGKEQAEKRPAEAGSRKEGERNCI